MTKLKEIKAEYQSMNAIDVIAKMEGGIVLSKALRTDLINAIDKIANSFQTISHGELLGLCATLRANLAVIRTLKNAENNKKILEEELEIALLFQGETE